MKRPDFVAELLAIWEHSVARMESEGEKEAANEIRIAIGVLEKTYTAEELSVK